MWIIQCASILLFGNYPILSIADLFSNVVRPFSNLKFRPSQLSRCSHLQAFFWPGLGLGVFDLEEGTTVAASGFRGDKYKMWGRDLRGELKRYSHLKTLSLIVWNWAAQLNFVLRKSIKCHTLFQINIYLLGIQNTAKDLAFRRLSTSFVCIKHIQMEGVEHKNPQSKQDRENSVSSLSFLTQGSSKDRVLIRTV